MKSLSEHH